MGPRLCLGRKAPGAAPPKGADPKAKPRPRAPRKPTSPAAKEEPAVEDELGTKKAKPGKTVDSRSHLLPLPGPDDIDMPQVNLELRDKVRKDLATIRTHPVFSDIMAADPLEIDGDAGANQCGYKVLWENLLPGEEAREEEEAEEDREEDGGGR